MAKKKSAKTSAKSKRKQPRPSALKRRAPRPKTTVKRAAVPQPPAIGRALVTQEEKLYMLFKEDYHARQIFEFLRVETVKDLEQFSPQQIVKLLSQPIQTTVQRIRRTLAEKNRHLADDETFVVEHKKSQSSQ